MNSLKYVEGINEMEPSKEELYMAYEQGLHPIWPHFLVFIF